MIMLNQSTRTKQNYFTWILIVLLLIFFVEDFFEDINNDAERWFDISNYDKNDKRPLQIGVNKKDELGGKTMKEFCTLIAKIYTYLMDDDSDNKKAKGVKRCIVKRRLILKTIKIHCSIIKQ